MSSDRNIFVRFFSAFWKGANGLRKVLHLLLLLVIFAAIFGAIGSGPPLLPQQAALVIRPTGVLVEQLAGDPFERALAEILGEEPQETLVQDVVDALDFAREDDRIKVVHLELSALLGASLDKLKHVGAAIDAFRESGKPVIASSDFLLQQGYYLGAHADELYMHPEGVFFLEGYGSYRNYYKDAIDLLKVDWNIFRVGTHKSAVEPFMRMDMSPEDRASRSSFLEQLWAMYQEDVVAARGLTDGAIADYAQNMLARIDAAGGDIATAAQENGFIDGLMTRTELQSRIKEYAGEDDDDKSLYSSVAMGEYLGRMRLLHGDKPSDTNVAIVVAAGQILDGTQPPGTVGGESTAALLREALNDKSVKAVVLRVDSPGGSKFASEVIAHQVQALQAAGKPVVASMSGVAASGGYWISAVADQIFASPSTITGSIGIFGMIPTFQRTMAAVGVATDGVGTTPWSGELRPDRALSGRSRQLIQMVIEDGYNDFVTRVADARGLDKQRVDEIGQGQVWTGADAIKNGLVDQLGGLDDAVAVAAELAELDEGQYGRKFMKPKLSPTQQMVLDMLAVAQSAGVDPAGFARAPAPLEVFANRLQALIAQTTRFNDPQGVYTHCFCEIE
jgi:protease-4